MFLEQPIYSSAKAKAEYSQLSAHLLKTVYTLESWMCTLLNHGERDPETSLFFLRGKVKYLNVILPSCGI